jgi:hypothetical protein
MYKEKSGNPDYLCRYFWLSKIFSSKLCSKRNVCTRRVGRRSDVARKLMLSYIVDIQITDRQNVDNII